MSDFFTSYEDELKKKTPSQIAGEQVKKTYQDSFTPYESKIVRKTPLTPQTTPTPTTPAGQSGNWFQAAVNALKGAGDAIKGIADKVMSQLQPGSNIVSPIPTTPTQPVTAPVTPGTSNAPRQPVSGTISKMTLDLDTQQTADISAQLQPNIIQSMAKDLTPAQIEDILHPKSLLDREAEWIAKPENKWAYDTVDTVLNTVDQVYKASPELLGFQKGDVKTLIGFTNVAQEFDKRYPAPKEGGFLGLNKARYTVGEIVGSAVAFIAGGQVLKGAELGRWALPTLFGIIGQTSAPPSTTVIQRIAKAPVDMLTGYLFGKVPVSSKLISPETVKGAAGAAAIVGPTSFISYLIQGMKPEEAAKTAIKAAAVQALFHTAVVATNQVMSTQTMNKETMMTPEAIRDQVEGTNLAGTQAGNDLLKLAMDAEAVGKNVKLTVIGVKAAPISKVIGKEATQAITGQMQEIKIVGDTITTTNPQGAQVIMKAEFVDPVKVELLNESGTPQGAGPVEVPAGAITAAPDIAAEIKPLGQELAVYRGAADQTIDVTRKMGITNGVSVSTDQAVAQRFADTNKGTVKEYTISPEAKVVDLSVLEKAVADIPIAEKNAAVQKIIVDNAIDAVRTDIPAGTQGEGEIVVTNPSVLLEGGKPIQPIEKIVGVTGKPIAKGQEFNVGDVLDPQGNTNMEGQVTIRAIEGNTLKFTDSKGTEFSGMQKSIVRDLIKGGSWKKVTTLQPAMEPTGVKGQPKVDKQLMEMRKTTLPEYNTNPDVIKLDAFVDSVRELDPQKEGDQVWLKHGAKYEVQISYPHSLGEQGNQFDLHYDAKPTIEEIKKDILDEYKTFKADVNKEVAMGIVAKSGRDENIETAIDRATTPLPSPTGKEVTTQPPKPSVKPVGESGGPGKLTLAPSKAVKPEEVIKEAAEAGVPGTIREGWIQGTNRREIKGYNKALITKQDIKTLIANSDEFSDNPVLTVNQEGNLSFMGKKIKFTMKPEALGLNPERIKPGDKIRIDEALLKEKGAPMQMRVYKDNKVLGFNPKNMEEPLSPKADGEMDKIIKQSEIAKTLSEKLGVPIRRGKFRAGGAIGIYKTAQKIVRIKSGGLGTVFHEVAHYLDDTIGFSKEINIDERKALMAEYGYTYAGQPNKQRMEAFAEFIRFRMTGQVVKALEMAPEFSKVFEGKIQAMPDVKSVLDTAAADYARWQAQPAAAKILSQLSIGSQQKGPLKDRVVNTLHDIYTLGLDDLHPLSEFSGLGKRLFGPLPATEDPYVLARNLRGWTGKADLFLNEGTFGKTFWKANEKGKTVMDFKGPGYSQIMKPIADAHKLDEFRIYIVAQRIINDLAPRSIKTGISLADAKLAVEELSAKNPEFEKVADARRQFNDQLLDFAKENGLLGEEGLKKIKELNKFYAPFYRVMEETGAKFLGKSKIGGNLPSPIKKIRGSEREIIDPLESDVKNVYAIINAAERNNIGVAMANLAAKNFELGRLFEEVAKPMKPVTVNAKEVLDKVMKEAMGVTGAEMPEFPEELADLTVTLFRPTQAAGPNMLNVNLGDVKKVYQVDPDLFKAIQGLNLEDAGIIMRILSAPAKWLRAGATLSPDFSVRNPLRDQFTAFAYSKYGFIPGLDLVRGMFELFKGGDVYKLWKAGGGEHSMFVSLDREVLQKSLKEVLKQNGAPALAYIKNPLKILQVISEFGEAGTRLGEMRRGLASGGDPVAVAFASRNVTLDFGRIGAWGKGMNMITAFWNANVQGTDMMIRAFKNRPFNTLFKVLLGITLPSILLYLANRKDKRWKEIPSWQKDLFWIVLTPKHIWRIPKPFELGILFGSVPERIMEYMDSKDPELFNQLGSDIATGFSPGFIPTGLIPIIENITNYSFFLDRPIVGNAQQGLPPAQQAGTYTSETAKIIGQALNYSPAKIDNMIFGYSGGLGKYAVQGIDKILTGTKIATPPTPPASSLEDQPVIKAYMIRNPIGSGSESVNRVYTLYSQTSAELTYVKKLAESGQKDKAISYIKDHPEVVNAPALSTLVTLYSQINKASTQVRNNEDLTPEQKRTKIDQLDQMQTDMAEKMLDNIKKQKKNE